MISRATKCLFSFVEEEVVKNYFKKKKPRRRRCGRAGGASSTIKKIRLDSDPFLLERSVLCAYSMATTTLIVPGSSTLITHNLLVSWYLLSWYGNGPCPCRTREMVGCIYRDISWLHCIAFHLL